MTDLPNPDLLTRIPWTARTVLDVGCAGGALGAAYRRLNPAVRLLGIDRNPGAADRAALHYDDVVAGDVEQDPLPFDLPEGLDCIVYGDVLEHLADPLAVLRAHTAALSPDGIMLICVPNVEHWSFAARLLRGDWEYEPNGLFDAGHLRWFSLETMRRSLAGLGLHACDVHPRVFEPEKHDAFVQAITPTLQTLGIDVADYARRSGPLQYVWRVRARPRRPLTIGASMLRPVGGVSDVRIVYPLRAMSVDPDITAYVGRLDAAAEAERDEPRIFVLHRPLLAGAQGLDTVAALLARGYLVVTEFDDHPDFFASMRREDQYAFSGVHAVQTSTPALAAILRERAGEVAVFPNTARALPEVRNFADPGHLTLFFGALNREADWQPLLPVLNRVAAAAGDRLRFSIVHDQALFDALETPHKAFTPTCDHDTYLNLLGAAEISLMPLRDTPFNRAKSDLKFVEAGACRAVPLASPVVYSDTLRDGDTGLLFASPEMLGIRLMQLLAQPEQARAIADRARAYVAAERMLAYQIAPRLAWYRSLWSRRAELNAALLARVPQLAAAAA